jgi:hypothetical protein
MVVQDGEPFCGIPHSREDPCAVGGETLTSLVTAAVAGSAVAALSMTDGGAVERVEAGYGSRLG